MQRRIVLILGFTYRGALEEYSSTFHFNGATPASEAGWKTVADELWTALKPALPATVSLRRAYGYEDGDPTDPSVATVDYVVNYGGAVPGTLTVASTHEVAPGDSAATLRLSSPKRSVKGKPVYSIRYFHPAVFVDLAPDVLSSTQKTPLETFGGKLVDGTLVNFGHLTLPDGTVCTTPARAGTYITTRTLKRRGKRPPTTP